MAKKNKYSVDIYGSKSPNDKFGMVYDGLLKSKAFQELECGARFFYIVCRVQARSKEGTSSLYRHGEEHGIMFAPNDFVFPASHMKLYGIDRSNGSKWMKQLIKAGFIEIKEQNKHRYKINVYSFSIKWKKEENKEDNSEKSQN